MPSAPCNRRSARRNRFRKRRPSSPAAPPAPASGPGRRRGSRSRRSPGKRVLLVGLEVLVLGQHRQGASVAAAVRPVPTSRQHLQDRALRAPRQRSARPSTLLSSRRRRPGNCRGFNASALPVFVLGDQDLRESAHHLAGVPGQRSRWRQLGGRNRDIAFPHPPRPACTTPCVHPHPSTSSSPPRPPRPPAGDFGQLLCQLLCPQRSSGRGCLVVADVAASVLLLRPPIRCWRPGVPGIARAGRGAGRAG